MEFDPLITVSDLSTVYGIALRKTDLVMDVDPRRFICSACQIKQEDHFGKGCGRPNFVNQLTELWKQLGLGSAPTFIVRTGGGGCHVYMHKPEDLNVYPRVPGFDAIELKTQGNYVVGAGSYHKNGTMYEIARHDASVVMDVPPKLVARIQKQATDIHETGIGESDDAANQSRFIQFLDNTHGAVEGEGGDAHTYHVACIGRDYALSADCVYDLMLEHFNDKCTPRWDDSDLRKKVDNAFEYGKSAGGHNAPEVHFAGVPTVQFEHKRRHRQIRWELDNHGNKMSTLANVVCEFQIDTHGEITPDGLKNVPNELANLIRYNAFTDTIEFTRPAPWHHEDEPVSAWGESDTTQFKLYLGDYRNLKTNVTTIDEAVQVYAQMNRYHPVRDYLTSLEWDGRPRLDTWLVRYASASDTPYTREVGKNTLIGAVQRVMNPGCKHDTVLVLEGKQGTGKSSLVSILGGHWYADIPIDPGSVKETVDTMIGLWIIEAGEMEMTRRADVAGLRAFITRTHDKVRLSYNRRSSKIARQSIIIGTYNPKPGTGYLHDTTGNRRFWPVCTGKIDLQGLRKDRDQLFAEAYSRFKTGEVNYIQNESILAAANEIQMERTSVDVWQEFIETYLLKNAAELPNPLTTESIVYGALNLSLSHMKRHETERVTEAMNACGYIKKKVYVPEIKNRIWAWVKPTKEQLLEGL